MLAIQLILQIQLKELFRSCRSSLKFEHRSRAVIMDNLRSGKLTMPLGVAMLYRAFIIKAAKVMDMLGPSLQVFKSFKVSAFWHQLSGLVGTRTTFSLPASLLLGTCHNSMSISSVPDLELFNCVQMLFGSLSGDFGIGVWKQVLLQTCSIGVQLTLYVEFD